MKWVLLTIVIVFDVAVGFVLWDQGFFGGHEQKPVNVYAVTEDAVFIDYGGYEAHLDFFKGKAVVINSWASWCSFCKEELPMFAEAQASFKDSVVFIAVNRKESLTVARSYSDKLRITDKIVFLLDPSDLFYRAIGGFSMPETIFADANGTVLFHARGLLSREELYAHISDIIQ